MVRPGRWKAIRHDSNRPSWSLSMCSFADNPRQRITHPGRLKMTESATELCAPEGMRPKGFEPCTF